MGSLRVLLVDDHPDFLDIASMFLGTDPGIEVIGQARSGTEAIRQVQRLQPQLVLMDVAMPDMNGLAATAHLKALPDPPRIIIVTSYDEEIYRIHARAVRADGFVCKQDIRTRLLPLIHTLFEDMVA